MAERRPLILSFVAAALVFVLTPRADTHPAVAQGSIEYPHRPQLGDRRPARPLTPWQGVRGLGLSDRFLGVAEGLIAPEDIDSPP